MSYIIIDYVKIYLIEKYGLLCHVVKIIVPVIFIFSYFICTNCNDHIAIYVVLSVEIKHNFTDIMKSARSIDIYGFM